MTTKPIKCAATPAALARQVDYVQQIIEDAYAGSITIVSELPAKEAREGFSISHWRHFDTDNERAYGIKAAVLSPVGGEGQLRLCVDVSSEGDAYGEVTLTTNPNADSALISALNTIAEINEKQNS